MRNTLYSLVLGASVAIMVGVPAARGAESDLEARLAALEQELSELRAERETEADAFSTHDPQMIVEAGAELTLLRLHVGSLVLRDYVQNQLAITPDYDLDAAFRVWTGGQAQNGLGWRATYWTFDDMATIQFTEGIAGAVFTSGLDLYTVDLELTRQGTICGWNLFSSLGARIGGIGIDETFSLDDNLAAIHQDFTGAGLTFSIGTRQNLGRSRHWSVYGGFRGSLLYGATKFDASATVNEYITFDGRLRGTVADQTVSVLEMQLGLQYERCTRFGLVFGRAGVETQLWELPPVLAGLGDRNVGLLGPTFAVGLRR